MPKRFPPVAPTFPHMLHGGDYNPEQWVSTPQVWDEDMRLLKEAHCNTVTVGVFSWVMLEPEDGRYEFGWLDTIMDKLAKNGTRVILATPGGAKPAWMAQKYPETLRVNADRHRQDWGGRHNHCLTSPVYRRKAQAINTKLAERYGKHPTLTMWHVNNEYNGHCHCDLCHEAFRGWLRQRYDNDLEKLNEAWWSRFWSHNYTDWSQVESPSESYEARYKVHGNVIDWNRFMSDQTIDCFRDEAAPLRRIAPNVPITTNFLGNYTRLDYYKFAKELDVVCWDSYPNYHDRPDTWMDAMWVSFIHSRHRAYLNKPFILMESAPGQQNYKPVCKQKRPGVHVLEGIQTIAHGSDSVLYFQIRKSRGGCEKFHGAVIDHYPTTNTRIFREVSELGTILEKLDGIVGMDAPAEVAVIYDFQNRWGIDNAAGPLKPEKGYAQTCGEHFRAIWQNGVNCDVIGEDADFERYKLVIAPMLYMIRPGVAERIERFVQNGGMFVTTYFSGVVNETDLCFLTGFPGPLRKLCGVWAEEIDALYSDEKVPLASADGNSAGLNGKYEANTLCEVIHPEGSQVLATYAGEFYAGTPCATVNQFGKGQAYYIASRNDRRFHDDLYGKLLDDLKIRRATGHKLPEGVTATIRTDGTREYLFLLNFTKGTHTIPVTAGYSDALTNEPVKGEVALGAYGWRILAGSASI